jgi:hypothetical protein
MEVLLFNLSLNLRFSGLSIFGSRPRLELPSSLTSHLADLRSTAVLLSSFFSDFSLNLYPMRPFRQGSHVLAGFTVMNAATELLFCYTLDAVSY